MLGIKSNLSRTIGVLDVLPQAAPWCLDKLRHIDMNDEWTSHLLSLEKYKRDVITNGWINPIVVWEASPEEFRNSPSSSAYTGQRYLPAIGWNRLYWSLEWGLPHIDAIIANSEIHAHSYRLVMEAFKRQEKFGIIHSQNFTISEDKLCAYDIYSVRHPQWRLPMFIFESGRIVERVRGEWSKLSGVHNVVRPMPGTRNTTSCFYIISGNAPTGAQYEACFIPEGWIGPESDEIKYRQLFREWI